MRYELEVDLKRRYIITDTQKGQILLITTDRKVAAQSIANLNKQG